MCAVIYNVIWATPSTLVFYIWKDANFDWRVPYARLRNREFYTFLLPSSLFTVWLVWLPAVIIIYCLPGALQIPLFDIVVCFWGILLQIVTKAEDKEQVAESATVETEEGEVDGVSATGGPLGDEPEEEEEGGGLAEGDLEDGEDEEDAQLAVVGDSAAPLST